MYLSLIIPFYNEEENLPLLVERLNSLLPSIGKSTEIIFIEIKRKSHVKTVAMFSVSKTTAKMRDLDYQLSAGFKDPMNICHY